MKGISGIVAVIVLLLVGIFAFSAMQMGLLPSLNINQPGDLPLGCPDDGTTSFKLQVFNSLNESGAESYDVTTVCTSDSGDSVTLTDTTDPTATDLVCGARYTCKLVSAQSADHTGTGQAHSMADAIRSGTGSISNGNLIITPNSATLNVDVASTQGGRIEARVYDDDAATFVYQGADASAGTYTDTGGNFTSSTSKTPWTVGSGGTLDLRMDVRINTTTDEAFEDRGFYVFVDASTSKWNTPTIKVDGTTRTSNCASLNEDEAKAYSGEEYCYKITDVSISETNVVPIDINIGALSGVNPGASDDFNITLVSIGAYQSTTNTKDVKIGAVKDDSSQTVVLYQEEYSFDVA